jgi:signal transduction histidine kinase
MSAHRDTSIASRLNSILLVISAAVVFVGFLVLIGWVFHLPGLNRIHPVLGGMNSHTAFCFVLAGTSLWLRRTEDTRGWKLGAAQVAATIVIMMGALTLSQWYGWGFGIDQFVHGPIGQIFPGRMPVATALAFLALGLALLLLDVEVWRCRPAEFLSSAAALISLLALIAYVFSFVSIFNIPNRRPLAFHTVLLLLAFSFGILAARPRRGLMQLATDTSVAGVMLRRMLPAAVGIPVLVGWLVMEGQRGGLYPPVLNVSYYALSIVVVFSTLIWLTAVALHRMDIHRQAAEDQVRRLNAELEQRVVERTAQLESANEELEAFSYSVSHDLRAPLRHVTGFASLLEQSAGDRLAEKDTRYLRAIVEAAGRMGRLIDDLLAFSRMGRAALDRRRISLDAVVRDALHEAQGGAADREIVWKIHPLPEVDADAAMLRLVFVNLLSNAIKYTAGRPQPTVEVGVNGGGPDETVIYVRDNGVGFDMAYAHKLFGVFQRLHSSDDFEGTGIGLANVRRIVHRHGGRVWAEGMVDGGATFFFSLPNSQEVSHYR